MSHYLLLFSMGKPDRATGQRLVSNLKKKVDTQATVLWIDSVHIGIAMTTELHAIDIWPLALEGVEDLRDVLIVELGRDWEAPRDTTHGGWLNSHLGPPLPRAARR